MTRPCRCGCGQPLPPLAAHNAYLREHRPPPKKRKRFDPRKQRLKSDAAAVAYAERMGLTVLRNISEQERRWLAQEDAIRALVAALDARILALPEGEHAALAALSAERRGHVGQLIEIDKLRIARFKARKRRRKSIRRIREERKAQATF